MHTYQALLLALSKINYLISDLFYHVITALDIFPNLYESDSMRSTSMPLTTSHFVLCLDGFLLMLSSRLLK